MKFSTKAEYGLRAIMHLADSKEPVSLAVIANQEQLSLAYLERIFALLKKANLVTSVKGVKGGYLLKNNANKVRVSEVIRALEGELYKLECSGCDVCGCKVHTVWTTLYKQIDKTLSSMTLKSLIK